LARAFHGGLDRVPNPVQLGDQVISREGFRIAVAPDDSEIRGSIAVHQLHLDPRGLLRWPVVRVGDDPVSADFFDAPTQAVDGLRAGDQRVVQRQIGVKFASQAGHRQAPDPAADRQGDVTIDRTPQGQNPTSRGARPGLDDVFANVAELRPAAKNA